VLPKYRKALNMKFTKTNIEKLSLPPGKKDHIEWDDDLPGFGVRIREGGSKSYVVQYRIGSGRGARHGRESIGAIAKFNTIDDARKRARDVLGIADSGQNPKVIRQEQQRRVEQVIVPIMDRYLDARKGGWPWRSGAPPRTSGGCDRRTISQDHP
jgi:hypothetical protein